MREKLGEMDRSVTTLAEEVENEMRQEQRLKPITLEGDQSGNQYLKKADLRRSWQRARLEKMKQAQMKEREELEPSRKISDDLEGRIDRIKK